jgi:hypothetical protein
MSFRSSWRWVAVLLLWPLNTPAWQFTALGGLHFAAPTEIISGSDSRWTGVAAPEWGLTVGKSLLFVPFEIETGVFFQGEESQREIPGTRLTRSARHTQVPLVIRFQFDQNISMGAGGYVSWAHQPTQEKMDAGLIINARAHFNLIPTLVFILDARYQHGLSNRATAANDLLNTRSVQGFAGIQFRILDEEVEASVF